MADINKIFLKKQRDTNVSDYVGTLGEIFYDRTQRVLKISDGTTQGGQHLSQIGNLYTEPEGISIKDTTPKIKFIDNDASGTPETLLDGSGGDLILDIDKDNEKSSTLFTVKIDGDEKLILNSDGKLLVGTDKEWGSDVKLHLANSGNTYLTLTSGTSSNGVLAFSDDGTERGAIDYDHDGNHMLFKTASAEKLRITSGRQLYLGPYKTAVPADNVPYEIRVAPYNWNLSQDIAAISMGNHSGATGNDDGEIVFKTALNAHTDANGLTEKVRINSLGAVAIGNNPFVHADTILHVEKPSGETNVIFEGDTTTLGARLTLKNNNTDAGAYNALEFADAGGQSTANIIGYNTDQTNNYGELVFQTRDAQGSPPGERLRIGKSGQIGLSGANYGSTGQVLTSQGANAAPTWTAAGSGAVVAVHSIENGTRTDINTSNAQTHTWGTFTKTRSDTKLVYTGLLHTINTASLDSDATGLFISFESSSVSQVKKRHVCRIDVTGTNFRERPISVSGSISASDTNAAETFTVKWGSDTNSNDIGQYWNPNNTDDARFNGQRESVLIIWEVLP